MMPDNINTATQQEFKEVDRRPDRERSSQPQQGPPPSAFLRRSSASYALRFRTVHQPQRTPIGDFLHQLSNDGTFELPRRRRCSFTARTRHTYILAKTVASPPPYVRHRHRVCVSLLVLAKTVASLPLYARQSERRICVPLLVSAKTVASLPPCVRHREYWVCVRLMVFAKTVALLPPYARHRDNQVSVSPLVPAKTAASLPTYARHRRHQVCVPPAPGPREDGRSSAAEGSSTPAPCMRTARRWSSRRMVAAVASPPRASGVRNTLALRVDDTRRNFPRSSSPTSSFEELTTSRSDSRDVRVAVRCGHGSTGPLRSAGALRSRTSHKTGRNLPLRTTDEGDRSVVSCDFHPDQSVAGGSSSAHGISPGIAEPVSPARFNRSYALGAKVRLSLPRRVATR